MAILPNDLSLSAPSPNIALEMHRAPSNDTCEEIRQTVKEITENCSTVKEQALEIFRWVFHNMEYQFWLLCGNTMEGVFWIWENRVGNCTAYTILYNFMLYLAGIPTVSVYGEGHEWTAALIDGQWIMIDSSGGRFDIPYDECGLINAISFCVDDTLCCRINDLSGIKLYDYGSSTEEHPYYTEITIPDYISMIEDSTFFSEDIYNSPTTDLVIKGTAGGYAEEYIRNKLPHYRDFVYDGDQFIASHTHAYDCVIRSATCLWEGFSTHTCYCGDSYVDGYEAITDHAWNGAVCTTCGTKRENPFLDIDATDYFLNPVLWAVQEGITNGVAECTFAPNEQCTRAQVVTFLWRAFGEPEPIAANNPFVDVKESDYFYKAVLWAVEKGITNGVDATHFGAKQACTRAQVATFLWRAKGEPVSAGQTHPFRDVETDAYYFDAVLWAVENGVTNGMTETTFAPDGTCTRGQIVTFLYRAMNGA